jgi:hypothetical protein
VQSGEAEAVLDALAMGVASRQNFPTTLAASIDLFTAFMKEALAVLKGELEFKTLLEAVAKVRDNS